MDENSKAVVAVATAEILKGVIMFAFEEARRRGLSDAEMEKLYIETRLAFLSNDPAKIPEV
jgi:hypothetical protein